MKTFAVIAAAAGIASAATAVGTGAPVYVTDVVTAYTTYCPGPTQISHNGVTYTVTSATTLTITNCPCTVTRPVSSATAVSSKTPPKPVSSGVAPPVVASSSGYFPPVPAPTGSATGTAAPGPSYTGAASQVQVAGAGLLALVGLAAAL